jgi:hypothetical protein
MEVVMKYLIIFLLFFSCDSKKSKENSTQKNSVKKPVKTAVKKIDKKKTGDKKTDKVKKDKVKIIKKVQKPYLLAFEYNEFIFYDKNLKIIKKIKLKSENTRFLKDPESKKIYFLGGNFIYEVKDLKLNEIIKFPKIKNTCLSKTVSNNARYDEDFEFSKDGFCITLRDSELNMAITEVNLSVNLKTKKIKYETIIDGDNQCTKKVGKPVCKSLITKKSKIKIKKTYKLKNKKCSIYVSKKKIVLKVEKDNDTNSKGACSLIEAGLSFSKNYLLVQKRLFDDGDEVYYKMYVIDLKNKKLVPNLEFSISHSSVIKWSEKDDVLIVGSSLIRFTPKVSTKEIPSNSIFR